MEERYVDFETAKLLKLKGFDVPVYTSCSKKYKDERPDVSIWRGDRKENHNDLPEEDNHFGFYSCPTQQMAMAWLREKHGFHIWSECIDFIEVGYIYITKILNMKTWEEIKLDDYEYSNENACEEGLKYVLSNLI